MERGAPFRDRGGAARPAALVRPGCSRDSTERLTPNVSCLILKFMYPVIRDISEFVSIQTLRYLADSLVAAEIAFPCAFLKHPFIAISRRTAKYELRLRLS